MNQSINPFNLSDEKDGLPTDRGIPLTEERFESLNKDRD